MQMFQFKKQSTAFMASSFIHKDYFWYNHDNTA